MLKALELSGFKSFADKTRFEFPPGVTVVVGPNGSGKSNLVDAVKWVLGTQSAKSLRGKEMTDVIFSGCGSRGPQHAAETTLTFDNRNSILPIDAEEVHVTRRVYRSGEGEYLINRQQCRLRDIRDLLAGTGITTEAYSIIEQGKVDLILQSSPRDRRVLFEEAAGISRFKAKKSEADRRLQRVEQNLLRLSDIVDEVESRLRSVKAQASKARRFRDSAERLEQLRTQLGLADWHQIAQRLEQANERLEADRAELATLQQAAADLELRAGHMDEEMEGRSRRIHELEVRIATAREKAAAIQVQQSSLAARRNDTEQEIARYRRQAEDIKKSAEGNDDPLREAEARLHEAESELVKAQQKLETSRSQLDEARTRHDELREAVRSKQQRLEGLRSADADLASQQADLQSQLNSAQTSLQQSEGRLAALAEQRAPLVRELEAHENRVREASSEVEQLAERLRAAERRRDDHETELGNARQQVQQLESQLDRLREREAVLAELQDRREGFADGVQQVLDAAGQDRSGPWSDVLGVVADLIRVDVDTAPLVEAALEGRSQYLVLRSGQRLLESLIGDGPSIPNRIGFLRLDARAPAAAVDRVDLSGESGVLGRADAFVESDPELEGLVRRLLGRTWLVSSLAVAVRLSTTTGRGLSFVTSDGYLLGADGTLVLGPRQPAAGLLSRQSELQASHDRLEQLERELGSRHQRVFQRETEGRELASAAASLARQHQEGIEQLAELRQQSSALQGRLEQVDRQQQDLSEELTAAEDSIATLREELKEAQRERLSSAAKTESLRGEIQADAQEENQQEALVGELRTATTTLQVSAASSEQRVALLRSHFEGARQKREESSQKLIELEEQIQQREQQLRDIETQVHQTGRAEAELGLQQEADARQIKEEQQSAQASRRERAELGKQLEEARQAAGRVQQALHRLELNWQQLIHEQESLCERLRDEYGVDLAAAAAAGDPAEIEDRAAVSHEIAELREKVHQVGAVNLDALEELDELEERFNALLSQYRDLVDSKAALERIVTRINTESRRLFTATMETVRGHFQELFRRLFGGGDADIVYLESDPDVLEAGIDIIARPPGKETNNISLLSGGEKTLTCVALLLAMFRSKPSPFCLLDEVDAALDEANIGRFVDVLRDFLSATQFIVVTHSKRTMVGADTIYGVTMEESGVSKLVSVRLEEVDEEGRVRPGRAAGNSGDASSEAPEAAQSRRAA